MYIDTYTQEANRSRCHPQSPTFFTTYCPTDIYDDITDIRGSDTKYIVTSLEEGTEYSITLTATLSGGGLQDRNGEKTGCSVEYVEMVSESTQNMTVSVEERLQSLAISSYNV